jgi:dephospho-CoA kinase
LSPTGEVDRKKLGQVVFNDPKARERLNRIMWSRIWEMIKLQIEDMRKRGVGVVVVEAFGLIEAGWDKLVDTVWVTVASEKAVVERLKKQRGLAEVDILARIHSQVTSEERSKHADVVIQNEGEPDKVRATVKESWDRLHLGTGKGD